MYFDTRFPHSITYISKDPIKQFHTERSLAELRTINFDTKIWFDFVTSMERMKHYQYGIKFKIRKRSLNIGIPNNILHQCSQLLIYLGSGRWPPWDCRPCCGGRGRRRRARRGWRRTRKRSSSRTARAPGSPAPGIAPGGKRFIKIEIVFNFLS